MNLSRDYPELSEGQLRMLERYVQEREKTAIEQYKQSQTAP